MLLVGECDDRATERIERLRGALDQAGIQSPPEPRVREVIWTKLIGNMSISVLCLLTGQTVKAAVREPALRDVVPRLLEEAQAVARSCYPDVKPDTRGGAPADHKPSLLQDYELGRAMEIDALVRAPAAFARAAGLSTPMLDVVAALASLKARDKGLAQALSQSLRSS
jgi:2-dehydropantoate 2-reductase